ncbi:GNAT family N-acetyltransferase [Virgibacillus byunsanensis]|uniref:GNAT family N-acetyltransferase n=1 Tax=Virgibacillus byunsanensis TaxID=570945 RepID=A0ABW3LP49_9BACI
MKQITFDHIYTLGHVVYENNQYRHFHYPEMLIRYDSNFLDFKKFPSLLELKEAENYLRLFHLKYGQKHVKFYFPANEKPTVEILDYLHHSGYETGYLELYSIEPAQFPIVEYNPDIEVDYVTEKNFETFLKLQYEQDLQFGSEFADEKVKLHKRNFRDEMVIQIMAFYKGIPAGSVDVMIAGETAEIDNLNVNESFQRKGIGSRLQQFVTEEFSDKTIILVADGEDTPKEMYRRQNYQYLGFKYETQKIYKD